MLPQELRNLLSRKFEFGGAEVFGPDFGEPTLSWRAGHYVSQRLACSMHEGIQARTDRLDNRELVRTLNASKCLGIHGDRDALVYFQDSLSDAGFPIHVVVSGCLSQNAGLMP